jgi:hypothetical protein
MGSLIRTKKHEELQNSDKASRCPSASIFGTLRRSRVELEPNQLTRSNISAQSSRTIKESKKALEKRFKDLNISTSYLSDDLEGPAPDSPVIQSSESGKRHPAEPSRMDVGTQASEDDSRHIVLCTIGQMFDMKYLDSDETADAISLSMRRDDTCDLILSLLRARQSLEGQGQFLKLWLGTRRSASRQPVAYCQSAPIIVKPKPMYSGQAIHPSIESSPDEDISLISTQTMVRTSSDQSRRFTPPNPSPPLFPTVLQFNDPMFHQPTYYRTSGSGPTPPLLMSHHNVSSGKSSLTPNSSSTLTGTPFDTLMVYSGMDPSPPVINE